MHLKNLSFASEVYLPEGWMGMVRLAPPPLADFERADAGHCRYHLDHDWSKPVGMLVPKVRYDEATGMYRCDVMVPEIEAAATKDYLAQREGGLRGDVSVGYNITRMQLVEIGKTYDEDKFDAAWELLEVSDVTVPADVTVGEGRSFKAMGREVAPGIRLMRGPGYGTISEPVLARAMADRTKRRIIAHKMRS